MPESVPHDAYWWEERFNVDALFKCICQISHRCFLIMYCTAQNQSKFLSTGFSSVNCGTSHMLLLELRPLIWNLAEVLGLV